MEIDKIAEQQYNIKILVKLEKSLEEIPDKFKAAKGKNSQKKVSIITRIKYFKDGWEDVKDYARLRWSSTSYVDENIDGLWPFSLPKNCSKIIDDELRSLSGKLTVDIMLTEHLS